MNRYFLASLFPALFLGGIAIGCVVASSHVPAEKAGAYDTETALLKKLETGPLTEQQNKAIITASIEAARAQRDFVAATKKLLRDVAGAIAILAVWSAIGGYILLIRLRGPRTEHEI